MWSGPWQTGKSCSACRVCALICHRQIQWATTHLIHSNTHTQTIQKRSIHTHTEWLKYKASGSIRRLYDDLEPQAIIKWALSVSLWLCERLLFGHTQTEVEALITTNRASDKSKQHAVAPLAGAGQSRPRPLEREQNVPFTRYIYIHITLSVCLRLH